MQNDKLLPCPFCSNKDVRLQHRGRTQYGYYVICKNCGCRTPLYQYQFDSKEKRREDAIKAWNTRKPMEQIMEQLEEKLNDVPIQYENNYEQGYANGIDYAIEIVRKGGVDNAG